MQPHLMFAVLMLVLTPVLSKADDRLVRAHVPDILIETGVVKFFAPRFTLKTQVKIELVEAERADLTFGEHGTPLFDGLGKTWRIDVRSAGHPGTDKLVSWLKSDVGKRTIQGFAPGGIALFSPPSVSGPVVAEIQRDGNADLGHRVSLAKCTRCHAVDENTRMSGIGSTPSFSVLRSLPDWEDRFTAFYVLNPHPSFTQISDVTEPFSDQRPSPIAPIEMTLDEVEAVLAYVASISAADLGKALEHQ